MLVHCGLLVPKKRWWMDGFWNSRVDPSWQQASKILKPPKYQSSAFVGVVVLRYGGALLQGDGVVLKWGGVVLHEGQAVFQGGDVDGSY